MPDREAAKRIFMAALDLDPPERPAFIAGQCQADAALQREVEALLAAHEGKPILDPATLPAQAPNNAAPKSKNIAGSARVGEEIGPYRLLERIGEGGFGEVWIAEQKTPVRRKVALKIIKAGMDTREVLARFEAERQALAVMDHPSVAKVFDAGATAGGRPYFVMEFVAGLPINAYCDSAKLRIKERLALFMSICHAVQHAHQKGIIHRDLKPGNIIVTLQDGKPVPKVIDFGIAKATVGRLTERTLHTETGRVIGTPEYMAPEQAGTSGLDVDTRADIYSLGVILYELLTGTLPLDGQTLRSAGIEAIGRMLNEFEPPKPSTRLSTLVSEPVTRGRAEPDTIAKTHGADMRTLQRELRGDLDWITLKALEKDRTRRYETASAFAADVDRHLTGEPVIAAPPSVGYRVKKFVRKHKAGAIFAATLVLATITTSGVSVWAMRERARAEKAYARAEAAKSDLVGYAALARHGLDTVMGELTGSPHVTLDENASDDEARIALDQAGTLVFSTSKQGAITTLVDNALAAIRENKLLQDRLRQQRDAAKLNAYAANLAAAQQAMAFKAWPEARAKLDAIDPEMRGWEWRFLRRNADAIWLEFPGAYCAEFSPDSKLILTASDDTVRLWDAATGKLIGKPMRHRGSVTSAIFSPDGKLILAASDDIARLWDAATCKPFGETMPHDGPVHSAAFSSDGRLILAASVDNARLWDTATGKPVGEPMRHQDSVNFAAFSPNGKVILTASRDTARLWDAATCKPFGETIRNQDSVKAAVFSPNGRFIVTTSFNDTVQLWDAATGNTFGQPMKHKNWVHSTVISPDGKLILTASSDGAARLWDAATGKPIGMALQNEGYKSSAAFSPDGAFILTASEFGEFRMWNLDGSCVGMIRGSGTDGDDFFGPELWASFSPDGRYAIVRTDLAVSVMSVKGFGGPQRQLFGEDVDLEVAAILYDPPHAPDQTAHAGSTNLSATKVMSPDGSRVVVVASDRSVEFHTRPTDQPVAVGEDTGQSVRQVESATIRLDKQPTGLVFSPDGTRLVVWLEDHSALVWDTRGPEAQQADRDARLAERKPAERYVDALWAGATPLDQLDPTIRADKSITPLRKLVALDVLRDRIAATNSSVQQKFNKVIAECITPSRVKTWVERVGSASNESTPLARRIHESVLKKLENWRPDGEWLNTAAWTIAVDPASPPDRIKSAIEAASMALGMNPGDGMSLKNLGAAQYRAGQFEDALKNLTKAVAIFDKEGTLYPLTLSFVAMCQLKLGNLHEERKTLRKLCEHLRPYLEGSVVAGKLTFRFQGGTMNPDALDCQGWFELAPDGLTFSGQYQEDNQKTWHSWTGSRKTQPYPERFDGLWTTIGYPPAWDNEVSLWVLMDGAKSMGIFDPEGPVLEAVKLYESTIAELAETGLTPASQPADAPISLSVSDPSDITAPDEPSATTQSAVVQPTPSPTTQPSSK